jgi:tRNA threonylcarbamoyladenosine biosynthesis protein TsaE
MKSESVRETQKIAKSMARNALKDGEKRKEAFILALVGDLGGGKTTFLQGFAKGLGVREKVLSPTFNIFKKYSLPHGFFYHFDCYRIEKPEEILALDFKETISDPQNIVAIEWADKIKEILPKNTKWLKFNFIDKSIRSIDINY